MTVCQTGGRGRQGEGGGERERDLAVYNNVFICFGMVEVSVERAQKRLEKRKEEDGPWLVPQHGIRNWFGTGGGNQSSSEI